MLCSKVLFFDESRFASHSRIGHGWFKKGTRPRVKIKLGYKNFYLYSAVDHKSGESFSLFMDYVNTECMNVYLEALSNEYSYEQVALIVDGAGWHKSKSPKLPNNIKLIHLPPYSPELNPVERHWLYIKNNVLRNKIYDTVADLEPSLCEFLKSITPEIMSSICSANYLSF